MTRAETAKAFTLAVRSVVGDPWTPEGWEDMKRREQVRLAFLGGVEALRSWFLKQSPSTTPKSVEINVRRYAEAVSKSSLLLKRWTPEGALEWLKANGLEAPKATPRVLPPLDLTGPSRPKVTIVNRERATEQQRMAAEARRAVEEAGGPTPWARPPLAKTREPIAELERAGAAE